MLFRVNKLELSVNTDLYHVCVCLAVYGLTRSTLLRVYNIFSYIHAIFTEVTLMYTVVYLTNQLPSTLFICPVTGRVQTLWDHPQCLAYILRSDNSTCITQRCSS